MDRFRGDPVLSSKLNYIDFGICRYANFSDRPVRSGPGRCRGGRKFNWMRNALKFSHAFDLEGGRKAHERSPSVLSKPLKIGDLAVSAV